jgi:hypothetical protein
VFDRPDGRDRSGELERFEEIHRVLEPPTIHGDIRLADPVGFLESYRKEDLGRALKVLENPGRVRIVEPSCVEDLGSLGKLGRSADLTRVRRRTRVLEPGRLEEPRRALESTRILRQGSIRKLRSLTRLPGRIEMLRIPGLP